MEVIPHTRNPYESPEYFLKKRRCLNIFLLWKQPVPGNSSSTSWKDSFSPKARCCVGVGFIGFWSLFWGQCSTRTRNANMKTPIKSTMKLPRDFPWVVLDMAGNHGGLVDRPFLTSFQLPFAICQTYKILYTKSMTSFKQKCGKIVWNHREGPSFTFLLKASLGKVSDWMPDLTGRSCLCPQVGSHLWACLVAILTPSSRRLSCLKSPGKLTCPLKSSVGKQALPFEWPHPKFL